MLLAYANSLAFGQKTEPTNRDCSSKNISDPSCDKKPQTPPIKKKPAPPKKTAPTPPKAPKIPKPADDNLPDRKADRF